MKRWLLILVCLCLPLQGIAAAHALAQCPMGAATAMALADSGDIAAGQDLARADAGANADPDPAHACCNDASTAAQTGQPCKAGADCHSPNLHLIAVTAFASAPPSAAVPAEATGVRGPEGRSAFVWRPPRFLS